MQFAEIICVAAAIMFIATAAQATNNDRFVEANWKQSPRTDSLVNAPGSPVLLQAEAGASPSAGTGRGPIVPFAGMPPDR